MHRRSVKLVKNVENPMVGGVEKREVEGGGFSKNTKKGERQLRGWEKKRVALADTHVCCDFYCILSSAQQFMQDFQQFSPSPFAS